MVRFLVMSSRIICIMNLGLLCRSSNIPSNSLCPSYIFAHVSSTPLGSEAYPYPSLRHGLANWTVLSATRGCYGEYGVSVLSTRTVHLTDDLSFCMSYDSFFIPDHQVYCPSSSGSLHWNVVHHPHEPSLRSKDCRAGLC